MIYTLEYTLTRDGVKEEVAGTILRFAKEYRIGHIIIGKPHAVPWWNRLFGKSEIVDQLLRLGEDFNLIVINTGNRIPASLDEAPPKPVLSSTGNSLREGGMELHSLVSPETIKVWTDPVSKHQVMNDLVQALAIRYASLDFSNAMTKLKERESQGSTFLNDGIALPHARIDGLETPLVALGLSHGGILDAQTENSIEVVFLLLSPVNQNKSHLQLLSVAARLMQNRVLRRKLEHARDRMEAFEILKAWDGREDVYIS